MRAESIPNTDGVIKFTTQQTNCAKVIANTWKLECDIIRFIERKARLHNSDFNCSRLLNQAAAQHGYVL
jgi:hypothetical protein